MKLSPITGDTRDKFSLSADQKGVVVTDVSPDGAAAQRGLKPGDVIMEVQQEAVNTPAEVQDKVDRVRKLNRRSVLLLIQQQDGLHYIPVPLDASPAQKPG
jgi:serine protease Do